ncbi:hypothetical protein LP418_00680 [Nocardioides sp. B-3]|nr:hypothetical protein [Nocardioides sp. B-3]UUZ59694.1 hypothetical protein LP418_00680 [Nocardioides sp. B-3]
MNMLPIQKIPAFSWPAAGIGISSAGKMPAALVISDSSTDRCEMRSSTKSDTKP